MIEPLAAAYRDAAIADQPFFRARLDELFALPEEKYFEVDCRGAFLLRWGKFNKFADFSHHFLLLQRFLF